MTTPNKPTPPPGYRLLTPEEYDEPAFEGELFWALAEIWKPPVLNFSDSRRGRFGFYAIPITHPATGDAKPVEQRQELLPCPFCGNKLARTFETNDEYLEEELPMHLLQYRVICDACDGGCGGSSGFRKTAPEARNLWNTRK